MKHIILSIFVFFFALSSIGENGDNSTNNTYYSFIENNYFDPGHKQKRGSNLGKDRSAIEAYLGSHPSFSLKLNFFGAKHGTLTERAYLMTGMDFGGDFGKDLHAKFGILLNPGKFNKNRSLSNPQLGWWKLWRYVMVRKALEIGYKTYFLDPEDTYDEKMSSKNYGGVTMNYSWIFDGNFVFDKPAWYFFDHRTARRIRLKVDVGLFYNLNEFNEAHIGGISFGGGDTKQTALNEDVVDDREFLDEDGLIPNPNYLGFADMTIYKRLSPFFNVSIGFAF